jgi:CDP-diacylglycerol--serine O-phosphatidyltransferase
MCNLFSGCIAVVLIFSGKPFGAIFCVGLSLLFDFLDGLSARLLKQNHPLGGDLDSLADVVSFGVVPGMMYHQLLSGLAWAPIISFIVYVGFIFTVFGAYRLARFNVVHSKRDHFSGLPIPAAAIFVTGLYWIANSANCQTCASAFINPLVLLLSIVFLSYLMVSELPHFSFKMKKLRWKGSEIQWIYLLLVLILILTVREVAVCLAIVLYVFLSLAYFSLRQNRPTN